MSEHNDVTCADPHDVAAVGLSPQVGFSAQGTLVGVTEVDVQTGAHTFKVDEPPALGGADAAANPVQYALASLGSGFFGVDDTVRARLHRRPGRGQRDRSGRARTLRRAGGRGGPALPGAGPVPRTRCR